MRCTRIDSACIDKLAGKLSEAYWQRMQVVWEMEELQINSLFAGPNEEKSDERLLNMRRILSSRKMLILCMLRKNQPNRRIAHESTLELFD